MVLVPENSVEKVPLSLKLQIVALLSHMSVFCMHAWKDIVATYFFKGFWRGETPANFFLGGLFGFQSDWKSRQKTVAIFSPGRLFLPRTWSPNPSKTERFPKDYSTDKFCRKSSTIIKAPNFDFFCPQRGNYTQQIYFRRFRVTVTDLSFRVFKVILRMFCCPEFFLSNMSFRQNLCVLHCFWFSFPRMFGDLCSHFASFGKPFAITFLVQVAAATAGSAGGTASGEQADRQTCRTVDREAN